jgi:hypothetical protein
MESLVGVERECDKANDLFETFYNDVDQNANKCIDFVQNLMNQISQRN